MFRSLAALAALAPTTAWAQTVTFELDPVATEELGLDAQALEDELGGLLADQLNLGDPEVFVQDMARANALASKGMAVDYASNFETFVFGGSLGTAVSGSGVGFGRGDDLLPEGGYSLQLSLMAGLNLGALAPGEGGALERFRIFVGGMGLNPSGGRQFSGSMWNASGHLQIKVIGTAELAKVVEWGGLDLTSGFEYNAYTLALASPELPISQDLSGAEITWTATGTYDVSASAQSVPIEVSTNFRILVASVYLGGAYDLNLIQSASSDASLSGPIDAAVAGIEQPLGSASVVNAAETTGIEYVPRLFGGVQANLMVIKVYGHLNVGLNNSFGGHLGLRVAM